jgi:HK97 family phage prohead protease
MNIDFKKYSKDVLEELKSEIDLEAIKNISEKQAEENGTFEVIVATNDTDRHGETINIEGVDISNYKKNPIVLFSHNWHELPIGKATSIEKRDGQIVAKGVFAPESANPMAQKVRKMHDSGMIKTVSIGLFVEEFDRDEREIKESEMVEFSFVPIPANPEAMVMAEEKGMEPKELIEDGLIDTKEGKLKDVITTADFENKQISKGVTPQSISNELADKDAEWSSPNLNDFTDESWEELDADEKRSITQHFAWRPSGSVEDINFSDLKLPHHRASDGAVVWNAVTAAAAAVQGARGGVDVPEEDMAEIRNHLEFHYNQFDETAPWNQEEQDSEEPEKQKQNEGEESLEETSKNIEQVALEMQKLVNETTQLINAKSKTIQQIIRDTYLESFEGVVDKEILEKKLDEVDEKFAEIRKNNNQKSARGDKQSQKPDKEKNDDKDDDGDSQKDEDQEVRDYIEMRKAMQEVGGLIDDTLEELGYKSSD